MIRSLLVVALIGVSPIYGFMTEHRAVSSYKTGDYGTALEQFETMLTHKPDDYALNYNAGKAAYQHKEYQAATSYFTQALKQTDMPDECALQAWFDLGNTHVKQQQWQEALASYEKVLTYNPDHAHAKEMIEKIKKLLDQKEQQQDNQQNQDQQNNDQKQDKDQQHNNDQEQHTDKQQKNKSDKNKDQQSGQQGQDDQEGDSQDESGSNKEEKKSDKSKQKNSKNDSHDSQQNEASDDGSSDEQKQDKPQSDKQTNDGKSSQNDGKKQDLNKKDTEKAGQEVGEKGKSDKTDKDLKQDRGDKPEDSIPDIQDHQRKDSSFDHSASPNEAESNSVKQDNPVAAKSQAKKADPFSFNDGIDKNSPEGKMLQFIEDRDALAAQQLLKMNTQTHRRPGEKNW